MSMNRSNSLDALRGFAILAMVLSSSIAFGILPEWMYHAQTPPPYHKFNPDLPGLTWVDLVFPFFLFSMGAAIPLALKKKTSTFKVSGHILQRYLLLVFFAVFTLHARAWVQSPAPGWMEQLVSIGCFVLLCFMFIRTETRWMLLFKMAAFAAGILFLYLQPHFDINKSDVIIIVLANMAFFGSAAWWLTRRYPLVRIGILPFIAAVFIAGDWAQELFNWSPLPWMYRFYYLKYLFIVIPGTFAGEWLLLQMPEQTEADKRKWMMMAAGVVLLVIVNLVGLQARWLLVNLALSVAIGTFMLVLSNRIQAPVRTWKNFLQAGIYLLWLGLCFDSTQGGIKKDPSSYAYYFVTGGLAFLVLLGFCILEHYGRATAPIRYLAANGRNPMVAYVAGNLLLLPLLHLTGAIQLFSAMEHNVWLGLFRGLLFTGIVSIITIFFVNRKWYWKT